MGCDGHVFIYRYDAFMKVWKKFVNLIRKKENITEEQYEQMLNAPEEYTTTLAGMKMVVEYIEHCENYHNWVHSLLEEILYNERKANLYHCEFDLLVSKELKDEEDFVMVTVWT